MDFSRLWHIVPWGAQGDFQSATRQLSIALTVGRRPVSCPLRPDYLQERLWVLRGFAHSSAFPLTEKSGSQGQSLVLVAVSVRMYSIHWLPLYLFLFSF